MGLPYRAARVRCGRLSSASLLVAGASLLALVSSACSGGKGGEMGAGAGADAGAVGAPDGGVEPVRAIFDPEGEPLRFGSVPWPDDLYRDAAGHVRVQALPVPKADYAETLAEALGELDGFGVTTPVYFDFDAPLLASSLPGSPEASTEPAAAAFLIDADTGSPTAFQRVPVEMRLRESAQELVLWPAAGQALVPGRRYAAVVTRGLRSEDGRPVEGSRRFAAIRDPAVMLEDALDRRAREQYTPVLETLVSHGVARDDVVAMAVFKVQTVGTELSELRELVHGEALAPVAPSLVVGASGLDAVLGTPAAGSVGLDATGGAPHGGIGWLIHGSFVSPNLLSAAAGTRGRFERNESGDLRIKRRADVPFTLVLPRAALDGSELPVVIVQHGWGGERSQALAVANALTAAGYAVFAIDAPFHGLRAKDADVGNRFTGEPVLDGFGDVAGDFAGLADAKAGTGVLHPFHYRDAVRQTVVDLMVLVRLIDEGDWGAIMAEMPALAGLAFDGSAVGFVGIDVGGEIGLALANQEPSLGALALGCTGGFSLTGWAHSPERVELFDAILDAAGLRVSADDYATDHPVQWPALSAWQALVDGADASAHAARARRRPLNALLWVARDDEVVPNRVTEALAWTLGATLVGGEPRHQPLLKQRSLAAGDTLSANFPVGDDMLTRVLFSLDPATHEALFHATGSARYTRPLEPPFSERDEPVSIDNPIEATLMQLVFFFQSWRACVDAGATAICSASLRAPQAQ